MAEFLIYNKAHWMDSLTPEELAARTVTNKHFQDKYDSRYQKGDIVEVRPDGFWTGAKAKGHNTKAFRVVACPEMKYEDALEKAKPLTETEGTGELQTEKIIKRREHKITVFETDQIKSVLLKDLVITAKIKPVAWSA